MKIIYGKDNEAIRDHAQRWLLAKEAEEMKHPSRFMAPRGIAHHTALSPIACDDCNETYWVRDPYAAHIGCRKGRGKPGFA